MDISTVIVFAINLILLLVVLGTLWWCLRRALSLFPNLPAPISVILDIVLVLVGLLIFVSFFQGHYWVRWS